MSSVRCRACRGVFGEYRCDAVHQCGEAHRLGDDAIHSGRQTLIVLSLAGVRRQRNHRDRVGDLALPLSLADPARRLQPATLTGWYYLLPIGIIFCLDFPPRSGYSRSV